MGPFRDTYVKQYQKETGIKVTYTETSYNAWYQACKSDGLNKTGAYDIYVMDDNWVPEFAAGRLDRGRFTTLPGDALAEDAAAW